MFCPYLSQERWERECEEVEERFTLFRSFVEFPFLGFRGVVGRRGVEYHVWVAAETDHYPKRTPWIFVEPEVPGVEANGRLRLDLKWDENCMFADVVAAAIGHIERFGA